MAKRKKSYTSDVFDYENDPNYTNVIKRDLETIMPKTHRLNRVTRVIMFSKSPTDWFSVCDGNIIRLYKKESVKKSNYVAMIRHLDVDFFPEIVKNIFDMYDARAFLYADLISQASFAAKMKLLKTK